MSLRTVLDHLRTVSRLASVSRSGVPATVIVAAAMMSSVMTARAQQAPSSDSILVAATIARFHQALATGDSATAVSLLAADAVILESGESETRDQYVQHHLGEDIAFAKAVRTERDPIRVAVRGDAAWAAGTSKARGEFGGRQINSTGAELMVLTRTPNGWRIAAIHWSSRHRTP